MRPPLIAAAALVLMLLSTYQALSYPPGVGVVAREKNCLGCHVDNGPWKDDGRTIIDILDRDTGKSFKQADGTFLITAGRNQTRALLTVIGRVKGDTVEPPYRTAWGYYDPTTLETSSLSKFAPGWDVSLPMSCRIVGDSLAGFEGATVTALPMSIRPTDAARDADLTLQVMLTKGESVKGNAKEGMIGSYFERRVRLRVVDPQRGV